MTTLEAAERLGLNVGTVRLQIAKGKLRARKVGRDWNVSPSEVERYRRESLGQAKGQPRKVAAPTIDHVPGPTVELVTRAENIAGVRPAVPRFCPAPKPSQRKRTRKASAE
jgi:excisionase family DNA binding protein